MTTEPVIPPNVETTKKVPGRPKGKSPVKRESKPEPELPPEVSILEVSWSKQKDLFSSSANDKFYCRF